MKKSTTLQLVLAALFTALGILLPAVFHPFGLAGSVFLPMHIPVLLCGFIVGSTYGALTGFIIPFLSNAFTSMPHLYPTAISMALELAAYGFFAGFLSKRLNVFVSLVGAMLAGRIVMGFANFVLLGLSGDSYIFSTFITAAFVTALPGIIIQLILIPVLLYALKKTDVMKRLFTDG
ncbi:MAG: ECF transporter S component [Caldicoprobacterales bacterium]|jgi:thiamine transporter ThiT|nr:ECF transporter S component [Clostridiales bacterium]